MAQILYGWCPEKRDRRHAANKEEGGGKREGEVGVMQLKPRNAQDIQQPRELGERHRTASVLEPSDLALISDFSLPELSESKLLLYKPPSVWYFVRAALGD